MTVPITYEYKIYRAGRFLGDLPAPSSPFGYSLDINNGAAPMSVEVPYNPFIANQAPSTIDDESGIPLQAEDGSNLETERQVEIFGLSGSGQLIANDNDIIVYEFSPDYPNGKKVYGGWITKWKLQHKAGKILIDCISYGLDLNDYAIKTGASTLITQETGSATVGTLTSNDKSGAYAGTIQTFAGSNNKVGGIKVKASVSPAGGAITGTLYQMMGSTPLFSDPVLGYTNSAVLTGTAAVVTLTLAVPVQIQSGITYYFYLANTAGAYTVTLIGSASNPYAGGQVYDVVFSPPSTLTITPQPTEDIYFDLIGDGNTTSAFSSLDPTVSVEQIMDNYIAQGGKVTYSGASVALTGLTESYTFITAKTLTGISKMLDLAPANWYWVVDPATSLLYFKNYNTTPDILLVLGQNIDDLELGTDAENVRNALYFTGGPTAGVNLLRFYQSASGLATTGRQRLDLQTDNRVTLTDTADAIGNSFLGSFATEQQQTTVTILRGAVDLTTILPGKTIGFGGFGNYIDNLVLVIVSMRRYHDRVECILGSIPPRTSSILKNTLNHVADLETLANPVAPS